MASAEERAQHLLAIVNQACTTLATSPSTAADSIYTAIRDVVSLPRLPLAGTAASMATQTIEHLSVVIEPLLNATDASDACRDILQLTEWLHECLGAPATPHLVPLTCAVLTAASPRQLQTLLPSPALDHIERLLLQASHAEWLLTCTLRAMDAAMHVPVECLPEALFALQCLQRLTLLGVAIEPMLSPPLLDVLHAACASSHVPCRASASCIALGALQHSAASPHLTHMV